MNNLGAIAAREKFIIAKNAASQVFKDYWAFDPTQQPIFPSYSVHTTQIGQECQIAESYDDRNLAELDCVRLNAIHPKGHYAVCPLKKKN